MPLEMNITAKIKFLFDMDYYLLQNDYDEATELFIVDLIDKDVYYHVVNYYEHPKVIELFTITLDYSTKPAFLPNVC